MRALGLHHRALISFHTHVYPILSLEV